MAWAAAACLIAAGVGYGVSELGQDDGGTRTLSAQVDEQRIAGITRLWAAPS